MSFSVILDTDLNLFSRNEVFTILMKAWFWLPKTREKVACIHSAF